MASQDQQNPHLLPTSTTTSEPPRHTATSKLVNAVKNNLSFKSTWAEVNGAMGDLGTYIPIVLALTLSKNLNLGTTLIFTGVYNIITGVIYGVPMPVQPMKSIAAVAISHGQDFGIPEIMAAGICTGGILMFLGLTGLMQWVYKAIPLSVVRGIQLSQGITFAMSAVKYIQKTQDFSKAKPAGVDRPWLGLDGLVLAIFCACFIVIAKGAGEESNQRIESHGDGLNDDTWRDRLRISERKISLLPSAFLIFLMGVIIAFVRMPEVVDEIKFGPSSIGVVKISKHAWKQGFIKGTIPQLPLSVLNSVIAVCKLSNDLFPERDFSATSVSVTVGLMNLAGCWFGAMPCCHGAGGLAGQYKFGGRSGGCVALLGAAKMILGLVLGSSLATILTQFPVVILGDLLLFAGIELAMACRDMNTKADTFVMLICAAVSLVSDAAYGFICGLIVDFLLAIKYLNRRSVSPSTL